MDALKDLVENVVHAAKNTEWAKQTPACFSFPLSESAILATIGQQHSLIAQTYKDLIDAKRKLYGHISENYTPQSN